MREGPLGGIIGRRTPPPHIKLPPNGAHFQAGRGGGDRLPTQAGHAPSGENEGGRTEDAGGVDAREAREADDEGADPAGRGVDEDGRSFSLQPLHAHDAVHLAW